MVSKKSRSEIRRKKHMKLRNRFSGTAERPRLAVFRSNNHMYAQIIDDTVGNTLVAASTLQKDVKAELVFLGFGFFLGVERIKDFLREVFDTILFNSSLQKRATSHISVVRV